MAEKSEMKNDKEKFCPDCDKMFVLIPIILGFKYYLGCPECRKCKEDFHYTQI